MAEPLSTAAAIVGLIVPALHGARVLSDDIKNVIDAPKSVQNLKVHVDLLQSSLHSLEGVGKQQWEALGTNVGHRSMAAIENCGKTCEGARDDLREWTKRSSGGKRSWREQISLGFFKVTQIKEMDGQLQSCNNSLGLLVGIATLSVSNLSLSWWLS